MWVKYTINFYIHDEKSVKSWPGSLSQLYCCLLVILMVLLRGRIVKRDNDCDNGSVPPRLVQNMSVDIS